MSDLTPDLSCLLNSPFAPLPLGVLEEPRQAAPNLPRGWPATPRAGPSPITARGRRSSSRRRRSTSRRRCRHGGGRSSGPDSPSSRAGTRRQPPPPWHCRASRRPRESSGTARLPSLAYCRDLRAAGRPLAVEPRAAAAQRRTPPVPGPLARSPLLPSPTILWRCQGLVVVVVGRGGGAGGGTPRREVTGSKGAIPKGG